MPLVFSMKILKAKTDDTLNLALINGFEAGNGPGMVLLSPTVSARGLIQHRECGTLQERRLKIVHVIFRPNILPSTDLCPVTALECFLRTSQCQAHCSTGWPLYPQEFHSSLPP